MTDVQLQKARQIIKNKPYLLWYVSDLDHIEAKTIVESVLNYGNWDDFKALISALGVKQTYETFRQIINQKRVNLKPRTLNYFQRYFEKHAH